MDPGIQKCDKLDRPDEPWWYQPFALLIKRRDKAINWRNKLVPPVRTLCGGIDDMNCLSSVKSKSKIKQIKFNDEQNFYLSWHYRYYYITIFVYNVTRKG